MIESVNNLNVVGIIDDDNNVNNKNIVHKQGKWKLNDSNKCILIAYNPTRIMDHLE